MLDVFKSFFKTTKPKEDEFKVMELEPDMSAPVEMDWSSIPEPVISFISKDKPTLLILDDITACDTILCSDFKNIERLYGKTLEKDFNIVKCYGNQCGFIAEKYLMNNKVDYGILDLTIGNIIKFQQGGFKEIDGVDIALLIRKNNPDSKYIFTTAHAINMKNNDCEKYFSKLREQMKEELLDHYYLKQESNRYDKLYSFLYGEIK